MEFRWMTELKQGGSLLLYRPGTSQAHQGPDIEKGLEEDDDEYKVLPGPVPVKEDFFHEDLFDNWRRSANPGRSLGALWTGKTECERADGNCIPFDHGEPRETLFIPPVGEVWTGRRHTVVKFVEDFPYGERVDGGKPAGTAPVAEAVPERGNKKPAEPAR